MCRHVFCVHCHGKQIVDGNLELFHGVWQRANEAPVDVDQVGQAIVSDQNWPMLFEPFLQSICELLGRKARRLFHWHEGSKPVLSEIAQVSSHQSLDDPSEPDVLDKIGPGLLDSSFHGLPLNLQVSEAYLDESTLASRPEIWVVSGDDLVHKAFLHIAQESWDRSFRAFHWWLSY